MSEDITPQPERGPLRHSFTRPTGAIDIETYMKSPQEQELPPELGTEGTNYEVPHTVTEYGVRYPDGSVRWSHDGWGGTYRTPEERREYQGKYDRELERLGLGGLPDTLLTFLTRRRIVTFTEVTEIAE